MKFEGSWDEEHTHIISYHKYLSQYMGLNAKSTKKCYTRLLFQNGMISYDTSYNLDKVDQFVRQSSTWMIQ